MKMWIVYVKTRVYRCGMTGDLPIEYDRFTKIELRTLLDLFSEELPHLLCASCESFNGGVHRFFFPSHIRFFLACEEKKARKKKCEKEQSEKKTKKSEEKASIFQIFKMCE